MARIAIAGWQHETNTFATIKADYQAFERADEWPPLCEGELLLTETAGVHLPVTGAIEYLQQQGHELDPLLWCSATPSAHVTEDAYERIGARLIALLQLALGRENPPDGLYLDLHGAMVCEHLEDGEGELLQRIRALVGPDFPVVVSLDLHANVTADMVRHASLIEIFRTYPHIDMGETGARAAAMLEQIIETGAIPCAAFRQLDFMIALNRGCSLMEPCQSLYARLPGLINVEVVSASFACGFHLADITDVGPSVLCYASNQQAADQAVENFLLQVQKSESLFQEKIWPAGAGVTEASRLILQGRTPVVLADTQDNPGGGGSGDTTGLLQELVQQKVANAVFGALADPHTVEQAWTTGVGGQFDALLGGRSGLPGQQPWHCRCTVLAVADGHFTATGPMYHGARMALGRCALLEIGAVKVVLTSKAVQTADQSIFRHLGIEPAQQSLVALKSSVHFRNDFTELAGAILVVAAPGAVYADPAELTYQHKRPELRVLAG